MGTNTKDNFNSLSKEASFELGCEVAREGLSNIAKKEAELEKANKTILAYEKALEAIKSATSVVIGLDYSGFELWSRCDDAYAIARDVLNENKK